MASEEVAPITFSIMASATRKGTELSYRMTLMLKYENLYGASIYEDPMGRKCVRVEDSSTEIEMEPQVNYQEDRYFSRNGTMYLVTETPDRVDKFGQLVETNPRGKEVLRVPAIEEGNYTLERTWKVVHHPSDDGRIGFYYHQDPNQKFIYHYFVVRNPRIGTITSEKTLYGYSSPTTMHQTTDLIIDEYQNHFELLMTSDAAQIVYEGESVLNHIHSREGPRQSRSEVVKATSQIDRANKSVSLIDGLMEGMGSYVSTPTPKVAAGTGLPMNSKLSGGYGAKSGPLEPHQSTRVGIPAQPTLASKWNTRP